MMRIYKTKEQNYFVDVDKNGVYFIVPIYMADNLQGSYEMAHVAIQMQKENGAENPFEGEVSKLKDFIPEPPYPFSFEPDFYGLKGSVKDQYGESLDQEIIYTIDGTEKAKITKDGLVEESVEKETSYEIVARVGKLEKRESRTLYPPAKIEPDPEKMALENSLNDLKKQAETLGMEFTQSKLQGIQERQIVQSLGKELAKTRVDNIQKDSAIQAIGRELSMVKIQLITMKGGGK